MSYILISFSIEETEIYIRLMFQYLFLSYLKASHFGGISTHETQPVHNET